MASNNAIGTGAIILTANADQMMAGLDNAASKTQKWAANTSKLIDSAGNTKTANPLKNLSTSNVDFQAQESPLKRWIFGTAQEWDKESGKFLKRTGGLVNNIKSIVGSIKGALTKALSIGAAGAAGVLGGAAIGKAGHEGYAGAIGGIVGGVSGGIGASVGAVLGSFAGPEGTVIGAGIGAAIGGGLGIAMASALDPTKLLHPFMDVAESLRPKVTNTDDAKSLDAISIAITQVDMAVDRLSIKFLAALAPAITDVSSIVLAALDKWGPSLQNIFDWIGKITDIGVQMGGAILGEIMNVIDGLAEWGSKFLEMFSTSSNAADGFKNILKTIAKVAGYVWDTIRAGAGIVSVAFGTIIKAVGDVAKTMADLARAIPESMRPEWANKFIDCVDRAGTYASNLGDHMTDWGIKAITSWGTTANKFGQIVDGIDLHMQEKKKEIDKLGSQVPHKLAGAFQDQSKEAYHVTAEYNAQGRDLNNMAKQQLAAVQAGNLLLGMINQGIAGLPNALGGDGVIIKPIE